MPDETGPRKMRALPTQVDLPALEREVLLRWDEGKVFERSLEQTAAGDPWVFYEGPPTANGMPGVHHVEARVFKDLFPRFKTMKGLNVRRKAGWDCHGLPVEVAVERELGLSGKKDIEAYGVAEFNVRCRESVLPPRRRLRGDDRAHGLLGRPGAGVPHDGPRLRRVGLVVAQGHLRQGAAGPRPPHQPVLPALRHSACPTTSSASPAGTRP